MNNLIYRSEQVKRELIAQLHNSVPAFKAATPINQIALRQQAQTICRMLGYHWANYSRQFNLK